MGEKKTKQKQDRAFGEGVSSNLADIEHTGRLTCSSLFLPHHQLVIMKAKSLVRRQIINAETDLYEGPALCPLLNREVLFSHLCVIHFCDGEWENRGEFMTRDLSCSCLISQGVNVRPQEIIRRGDRTIFSVGASWRKQVRKHCGRSMESHVLRVLVLKRKS